jgi:phosphopantothenoylcysteine decarboxylase/phosphopantothenate--cysteine ligase
MRVVPVRTAREMHRACLDLWPDMDVAVCTAAVSDFSPEPFGGDGAAKFKKDQAPAEGLTLRLVPNPDILADLGASKRPGQLLAGFAAETSDLAGNARAKLTRKSLDLIVANRVDLSGSGFAASTNAVLVLDRTGREESWPVLPKTEVAWRIWDAVSEL